jgi:para-aminobenzoate synthetase component 1
LPLACRLPEDIPLEVCFRQLHRLGGCLWLDSAARGPDQTGRYSFLTADPIETFRADASAPDPWPRLARWAGRLPSSHDPQLPPFQGGIAGVFGYEAADWLESLGRPAWHDLPTPPIALGLYDWVIAEDHDRQERWLIAQGFPGRDREARRQHAAWRIQQIRGCLEGNVVLPRAPRAPQQLPREPLAPQFATARAPGLTSNFSPAGFRAAVAEIVEAIRNGDSFQVNLAQRLIHRQTDHAEALYLRLRQANPAPMGGYFDGGTFQVLSTSPEGFLRVRQGDVETRPIKGTTPRTGDADKDRALVTALRASEKDRAENIMIVDLMRNDLSRRCQDDSVTVEKLCAVEPYAFVQHLVSVVHGHLRADASIIDLIQRCFPGGSITGAPKLEAMRTIRRLEPTARGPYCGSLGYIGCGGFADLNILIRTVTVADGWLQIPVGGGITAGSDPAAEEAETWAKAEGMLRAVLPADDAP